MGESRLCGLEQGAAKTCRANPVHADARTPCAATAAEGPRRRLPAAAWLLVAAQAESTPIQTLLQASVAVRADSSKRDRGRALDPSRISTGRNLGSGSFGECYQVRLAVLLVPL